jgi:hypothetical protein
MSTAGVVQLVIWGVVVVFIAAMFFRGWRKQVRSRRTETPEEAYRRVQAKLRGSRKRSLGAAGGFGAGGGLWLAGTGTGWGSDGFSGDSGGDGGGGCGGGGCGGGCGGGS